MKSLRPSKWSCSDFGLNNRQKSEQFQAFLTLVAYAMGVGRETTAGFGGIQNLFKAYAMGVGRETTACFGIPQMLARAYAMGVGRETTAEVSPTQRQVQLLGEFVLSRKVRRDRGAKFPNILERK